MNTNTEINTLSTDPVEISRRLLEPFSSTEVKFRVGATNQDKTKGLALAYIDARNVQNRLDEVVGCAAWKQEFFEISDGIKCRLSLFINGQWISKEDVSSVENVKSDAKAEAKDMAKKGDHSDAFKRAAVMWGIGRYLYGFDSGWVPLKNGKYLAEKPWLPNHMLPAHERKTAGNKSTPRVAPQEAPVAVKAQPAAQTPVKANTAEKASPAEQSATKAGVPTGEKIFGARWAELPANHQRAVSGFIKDIADQKDLARTQKTLTTGLGATLPDFVKQKLLASINARLKAAA